MGEPPDLFYFPRPAHSDNTRLLAILPNYAPERESLSMPRSPTFSSLMESDVFQPPVVSPVAFLSTA